MLLYTSPVRSAQKALLGRALRLLGCGWCATGVEMSEALMWSGDLLIAIVRLIGVLWDERTRHHGLFPMPPHPRSMLP